MAKLGWLGSVALAVGASAGAAAAQFGLGYGLGIISWTPLPDTGPQTTDGVWLASLAWTTAIATTSTVVGALCADRRSAGEIGAAPPRLGGDPDVPAVPGAFASSIWRVLLAVAAAVGSLLAVALVLVPARDAVRPDTSTPQYIAAGYAIIGIVAGIVIAVCALIARAGATNVVATAAWLWILAIASVIDGVIDGRGLGTAPLGVWPFRTNTQSPIWSWPVGLQMLIAAFVIGVGVAWAAMRRGDGRVGASGLFGPLLVVVAYDLTAPRLVGVNDPQIAAYIFAPQALVAGLIGSMLTVTIITARARARQAAIDGETIEFRAPTEPVSARKKGGTAAVGETSQTGQTGPVNRADDAGGRSGAAVGRARPLARLRGKATVTESVPAPTNPATTDETTQRQKPAAVVPTQSSRGAADDSTASSAASPTTSSTTTSSTSASATSTSATNAAADTAGTARSGSQSATSAANPSQSTKSSQSKPQPGKQRGRR